MKRAFIVSYLIFLPSLFSFSQNVGIGTASPIAKLHIKGSADTSQLVIDANSLQSNTHPLIKLRNSTGAELLRIHSDDTSNLFIGLNAGRLNNATISGGTFNTFIGGSAGSSNSTGSYNTASGESALTRNTTGNYNSAYGGDALIYNISGSKNTAVGVSALAFNNTGNNNTAIGVTALYANTSGHDNTATGLETLYYNTSGYNNTANGVDALLYNTTGSFNTAMGYQSLFSNTVGSGNIAIGYNSMSANTTGNSNVAIGDALYENTTGNQNIAMGTFALRANTTGGANTSIGDQTLSFSTISSNNTAIGSGAGYYYNFGWNNTFIGNASQGNADGLFNCIALGQSVLNTSSNQARIGNASITSIGGYAGWSNVSDGRVKKNISSNVPGLVFINKLKPVIYNLDLNAVDNIIQPLEKKDKDGNIIPAMPFETEARKQKEQIVYSGFIAQEVEKAAKELGYDFSGVDAAKNDKDLYSLRYAEFVVPLVKAVQELSKQNDDLKKQSDDLKKQNEELINRIGKMESLIIPK